MNNLKNKGAAMISVLVATVFIAIIATTLLYMAYLNYLTKAVRNASNDNFYTCEFALDDLATTLQQMAAETDSPTEAVEKITLACTGSAGATSGRYDNAKVASIIKLASEIADISVSTNVASPTNNYIVSANSITLKGLVITSTSKSDADPYKASITTDLTLTFNASSDGGMNVNDFSVIGDDTINWCGGGVMVMTGNIFIRSQGWINQHVTYPDSSKPNTGVVDGYATDDDDYTHPERDAIICGSIDGTATQGDILSLTGDKGIIVGNVVVGNGGVLTITGNMNIVGNIYVVDGGTLMCTDNVKCSGGVFVKTGGLIKGVASNSDLINSSMNIEFLIDKDKAGTGIAANIFDTFYFVYPLTGTNSQFVKAPFSPAQEEKYHTNNSMTTCSNGFETNTSMGYLRHTLLQQNIANIRFTAAGTTAQVVFAPTNPLNGISKPSLMFNVEPMTNPLVMEQNLDDSTILSISRIGNKKSFQNGIRIAHMSDDNYQEARNQLMPFINIQADYWGGLLDVTYIESGNSVTNPQPASAPTFASGTIDDMKVIVTDWKNGVYDNHGSDGVYVLEYTSGKLKQEQRYSVYKDGKIYFPAEYLIRPDAGEFITQIFNSIDASASPTNTNVIYDNWKKNDI